MTELHYAALLESPAGPAPASIVLQTTATLGVDDLAEDQGLEP